MPDIYYTPQDVASILQLSKNNVYKLFKKNNFPAIKVGSKWVIKQIDFDSFMEGYKFSKINI